MDARTREDSQAASESEFRALLCQLKPADLIDIAGLLTKATLAHQIAQASMLDILANARCSNISRQACGTA